MTDPNDNSEHTLEALMARGKAEADARPQWTPSPTLLDAMADLQRTEAMPAPPAPDPVVVLPEKRGEVIVAATEAAETYLPPTTVHPAEVPRLPSGPVRIRTDMDLRRRKTMPSLHREALPEAASLKEPPNVPSSHPPPPSTTTPAKVDEQPRRGRIALVLGVAVVAAMIVLAALLRSPSRPSQVAAGGPSVASARSVASATASGRATASGSANEVDAAVPQEAPEAAPSVTPSTLPPAASTPVVAPTASTSSKAAPPTPVAPPAPPTNAIEPPVKSAPSSEPATTVAPAVSSAPIATPPVPTAPPSKPTAAPSARPVIPLFKIEKE